MLKGVTFDLWFTLLPSNRLLDSAWRKLRNHEIYRILLEHGYLFDYVGLKNRIRSFDKHLQERRRVEGIDFSNDDQVALLLDALTHNGRKNKLLHDQIKATFTEPLLHKTPPLANGVSEMLSTLKADGWKIGLISNTGKTPGWTFRSLFQRWGILQYFDDLTFSDEVEAYKPNPKIFRVAESQLQLQPSELVHVGDMISADVCGALEAGWQAIHFTRYLNLRYLDENERDAQVIDRCPPHETARDYKEVVQKLSLLRDNS
jgi:putative hydrolase of the HAD superfamily